MNVRDGNSNKISFLEFMPVSLFGGVMGLSALCFAWRLACKAWNISSAIAEITGMLALLTFAVLSIAYTVKWIRYPASVENEFKHPVSVSFFSTIIISILLIPGILLPYAPVIANVIWLLGVLLIFLFAWFVLRKWMNKQQLPENAMPVWVLPVTGTLNVPIVGNSLQFAGAHEFCLMFFGFGIIFIIILMAIIFSRLFFQPPIAISVQPSLMILVAPFALAFNGYMGLSGTNHVKNVKARPTLLEGLYNAIIRAAAGTTYNLDGYTQVYEGASYKCNQLYLTTETDVHYRYVTGMTSGDVQRIEDRSETPVYGYDRRRSYTIRIRDSRGSATWRTVADFSVTENVDGTGNGGSGVVIDNPPDALARVEFGSPKEALKAMVSLVREQYPYPAKDTASVKVEKGDAEFVNQDKLSALIQRISNNPLYRFDTKDSLRGGWYDETNKRIYLIKSGDSRDWLSLNTDQDAINEFDSYQNSIIKVFGVHNEDKIRVTWSKNGEISRKEMQVIKLQKDVIKFDDGTAWKRI